MFVSAGTSSRSEIYKYVNEEMFFFQFTIHILSYHQKSTFNLVEQYVLLYFLEDGGPPHYYLFIVVQVVEHEILELVHWKKGSN